MAGSSSHRPRSDHASPDIHGLIMYTAFLFPGQGAQSTHFLRALPDSPAVRETLAESARVLEIDMHEIDSDASLQSTVAVQLGTLIAGVAYTRFLALEGVRPDVVAGLSVGAFAAAVASGALPFEQALRLVKLRAEAMEREFGAGGHGMAAILGLDEPTVQRLIERVERGAGALYLASVNAPNEIVVAGSDAALAAVRVQAEHSGARVRRLKVSVPSHGPLLDGVSARLREAMAGVRLERPRVPYVSNQRARALEEAPAIADDLILNVSRPVRWHESVLLMYELGARLFIEVPPGRALSHLVEAEFPLARALAAADVDPASIAHLAHARGGPASQ
jgi:malonate decarboxylase epsilon subunit